MRPIPFESKYFFGRRKGRLRLDPAHRFGAPILKTVDATHAGPDHIARAQIIYFPIRDGANSPAHYEIRFLKSVIVRIDLRAGEVLNQKQRLVDRSEGSVYEHLDSHTCSGVEAFHL